MIDKVKRQTEKHFIRSNAPQFTDNVDILFCLEPMRSWALKPWLLRKTFSFFKEGNEFVFILCPCFLSETLFQEQKKHLVLLKRTVECTSECLLRNSSDTGCLILDIACVVVCVCLPGYFYLSEGLWRKLSKPRSFISSGPNAPLSSAGGFPSSPFTLFSRLLLPTLSSPSPQEKHTHMLHRCSQIVFQ